MQEKIRSKSQDRVKFVERTGANLGAQLVSKDPWGSSCNRPECNICSHQPGKCDLKGVVYQWECLLCKEEGIRAHCIGETSRTCFERMLEHRRQIEKGDGESPLVEHLQKHHSNMKPEVQHFKLEVLRRFPKAMGRQIYEGHMIASYTGERPINRRGDWGQNLPPKFTMDDQTGIKGGALPQKVSKAFKRKSKSCEVAETCATTTSAKTDRQLNLDGRLNSEGRLDSQMDKLQPALKKMRDGNQGMVEALTMPTESGQFCPLGTLQCELNTQIFVISNPNTSGNNSGVSQGQVLEEKTAKSLYTCEGNKPRSSKRSILSLENGRLVANPNINTSEMQYTVQS